MALFFSSIREWYSGWSIEPLYIGSNPIGALGFALNRTVVERKHIGLIIQRTQDQNLAVRFIFSSLAQRKSAGPFKPEAARSKLAAAFGQPVIAQLVERLTVDQLVACSTQADGISSQRVRKNSLPFWSHSSVVERTIAVRLVVCSTHTGSFGG